MKNIDTIKITLPEEIKHAASVSSSDRAPHKNTPEDPQAPSEVKIDHIPMLLQAQSLLQRHRATYTPSVSSCKSSFPRK